MAVKKSERAGDSGAEDRFAQLFCEAFGEEKGQFVYLQHPFVDIYDETNDKSKFRIICRLCEIFSFRVYVIFDKMANKLQSKWYSLVIDVNPDLFVVSQHFHDFTHYSCTPLKEYSIRAQENSPIVRSVLI